MPYTSLLVRDTVMLCFPPEDALFAEAARRAFEAQEHPDPASIEAALRPRFPRVLVRERDPLASYGSHAWYLYRDGRYSPFGTGAQWWTDPDVARVVLSDTGAYLDANAAALEVLGVDLATLRAAAPASLSIAAQRPALSWTLQLLMDSGELHSTATIHRGDGGSEMPVEFHLTKDGDGPGRHVSAFRTVPQDIPGDVG